MIRKSHAGKWGISSEPLQIISNLKIAIRTILPRSFVAKLSLTPRRHELRCGRSDRTLPDRLSIGPPPVTGKRGSRGIPRPAGGAPISITRQIAKRGQEQRQGGDGGFRDVDGGCPGNVLWMAAPKKCVAHRGAEALESLSPR